MLDIPRAPPGFISALVVGKKEYRDFRQLHEYVLARSKQIIYIEQDRPLRITFNIGGKIFETLTTSIRYKGNSPIKLLDPDFLARHWHEDHQWYFFDRDHECFNAVLNFIRTGALHLPKHLCSPQIASELIYWGIPRFAIQACCWKDFSIGIKSIENLRQLEKDRQPKYLNQNKLTQTALPTSWYQKMTVNVWKTIYDPSHSMLAKGYWFTSQMFVIASIVLFALATMPNIMEEQCGDTGSTYGDICILNIISTSLEQLGQGSLTVIKPLQWIFFADSICFSFFVCEIVLIIFSCPYPMKFLRSSSGLIEILALVPDCFTIFLLILYMTRERVDKTNIFKDVQVVNSLRIFRVLRLFRLFRLIKRMPQLMIIVYSIWASLGDLFTVGTFVVSASIFFASILYFIPEEHDKYFINIPVGVWYGIVTMTTVGYGDIVPISLPGRILGVMCAVCGVLVLGLSAPTLVHNFLTYFNLFRYIEEKEKEFMGDIKKNDKKNQCLTWDIDF